MLVTDLMSFLAQGGILALDNIQVFASDGSVHAILKIERIGADSQVFPAGANPTPPYVKITLA